MPFLIVLIATGMPITKIRAMKAVSPAIQEAIDHKMKKDKLDVKSGVAIFYQLATPKAIVNIQ